MTSILPEGLGESRTGTTVNRCRLRHTFHLGPSNPKTTDRGDISNRQTSIKCPSVVGKTRKLQDRNCRDMAQTHKQQKI